MTPKLTDDQRQAIEEQGGAPVFVVDATTNATYVLMRAEHYDRIKAVTNNEDVEAMFPMIAGIDPEDWEDASNYDGKP